MNRVDSAPAWLLHARAWRESSQLLEVLTPLQGRVGLVARGSRGKRGQAGLLQPFQPLRVSWVARGELGSLRQVEPGPPGPRLLGESLICGLYLNELIVRALPRGAGDPLVFVAYGDALEQLGAGASAAWALRRFELRLLQALGHLPDPLCEAGSGRPVQAQARYRLQPGEGLEVLPEGSAAGVAGVDLIALAEGRCPDPEGLSRLRPLLRRLVLVAIGEGRLRSGDWMTQLRRWSRAESG